MLPAETRDRLGKLIPRLASDQDGEVVATARAIERTLRAAEADWHSLAAIIVGRRTGWVPPGAARAAAPQSGRFSYADAFKQAEPLFEGPPHPDALTGRFGLAVYSAERTEPWWEVARHILLLDRTVPKKLGGKHLEPWQKALLKTFINDLRLPTNRHVEWIERTVARLHQGRDAAAKASERAAA